ncbi:MAG: cytochrome c family protein [Caulobacteraceae bacterium]
MSDLRVNKILGAVLATGLVILGLQQVSELVFATKAPEKPGYAIAVAEESGGGEEKPDVPPDWGTVLASADVAAGQTTSSKCLSCHTFTNGGANATGPNLWGAIPRKPGSHPGFAYSPGMTAFAGAHAAWDYDTLYTFLANPQKDVAGTKMTFVGLKKPEERINMIAWLRTQSDSPAPIPAPKPAAAPAAAAPATGAAPAGNATAPAAAPATAAAAAKPGTVAAAPGPAATTNATAKAN